MKCSRCGNEVGGAGQYTQTYSFLCFSCSAALDMTVCTVCGQRFPRSQMKAYQGEFFCNDDYRGRMAQIESYKPKPQPKGTPLRGGAGTRIKRRRPTKSTEPYEPIVRELRAATKPETGTPEKAEQKEKPLSPEEEKAEISELLKGINEERSSEVKKEKEEVSETLNELRKSRKEKKDEKKE